LPLFAATDASRQRATSASNQSSIGKKLRQSQPNPTKEFVVSEDLEGSGSGSESEENSGSGEELEGSGSGSEELGSGGSFSPS
jgi:hypothetical protein